MAGLVRDSIRIVIALLVGFVGYFMCFMVVMNDPVGPEHAGDPVALGLLQGCLLMFRFYGSPYLIGIVLFWLTNHGLARWMQPRAGIGGAR